MRVENTRHKAQPLCSNGHARVVNFAHDESFVEEFEHALAEGWDDVELTSFAVEFHEGHMRHPEMMNDLFYGDWVD